MDALTSERDDNFRLCITFPDSQGSQSASIEENSVRTLQYQPFNRALVIDFDHMTFIQYLGFFFKWNSSSSTLQFTVDYSVDGLNWNDFMEDEQVKVKRNNPLLSFL